MDAEIAKSNFERASQLFEQKEYAQALTILDELERFLPKHQAIMYARTVCLRQVGRLEEALRRSQDLISGFGDKRAIELERSIREGLSQVGEKTSLAELAVEAQDPASAEAPDTSSHLDSEPSQGSVKHTRLERFYALTGGIEAKQLAAFSQERMLTEPGNAGGNITINVQIADLTLTDIGLLIVKRGDLHFLTDWKAALPIISAIVSLGSFGCFCYGLYAHMKMSKALSLKN